jgi:hypothetical protein
LIEQEETEGTEREDLARRIRVGENQAGYTFGELLHVEVDEQTKRDIQHFM